jgi:hypothetical protein
MTKTKKKNVLGGHNYVVEEVENGCVVHKILKKGEEKYFVTSEGLCDCKAADFGNDCKHQELANGSLQSLEQVSRRRADDLVEDYLDKFRGDFPRGKFVSLVRYKSETELWNAAALAFNVFSADRSEKTTLWTEYEGLLIRIHCFRDKDRYQRTLSAVRKQWKS